MIKANSNEELMTTSTMLEEAKRKDYLLGNTIYLDCEIDRASQVLFCRQLEKLANQELKKKPSDRKPIKIKISSYGGVVWDTFAMISCMEYWQEQGIIIETICYGYACSGASKILMAGTKGHRQITRYARILIHQSNSYKCGHSTLQEDIMEVKNSKEDFELIKKLFRKHTKLSDKELDDLTEKNVDVLFFPNEAKEKGIVDIIL